MMKNYNSKKEDLEEEDQHTLTNFQILVPHGLPLIVKRANDREELRFNRKFVKRPWVIHF